MKKKVLKNNDEPVKKVTISTEEYFKLREDQVFVKTQGRLFALAASMLAVLGLLGWFGIEKAVDGVVEDVKKKVNVESIEKEVKDKLLKDINTKKEEIIAMMEREVKEFKEEMYEEKKKTKGEVMGDVEKKLTFWLTKEEVGSAIYPLWKEKYEWKSFKKE